MTTILIADDVKFTRLILQKIISSTNHKIIGEVVSGEECIEEYSRLRPDIVIIDVGISNSNGLECLKQLRELDPNVKIIVVTGYGQENLLLDFLKAGAVDFIIKPFKADRVIATIDQVARNENLWINLC